MKAQKLESITTFEAELAEALTVQEEKEAVKMEVEAREKVLLDVYNEKKELEREAQEAENKKKDEELAMETFEGMDANKDELLQRDEAKASLLFDQNNDGSVSEEELTFFMSDSEGHNKEDFLSGLWSLIKHRIKELAEKQEMEANAPEIKDEEAAADVEELAPVEHESQDYDGDYDDLDEDDEHHRSGEDDFEDVPVQEDTNKDDYDPETRAVVDEADAARSEYETVRGKITDLQEKINQAKNTVETDYGFAEEFATLKDQCFEFTDNEYTYKHCVFDFCEQKPKHGGSGTRLGKFEQWVHEGGEENSYTGMMYSGGQQCWNGPARSTKVIFRCGLENKLLSVSEPNKCEYEMVFETPASCSDHLNGQLKHDEL